MTMHCIAFALRRLRARLSVALWRARFEIAKSRQLQADDQVFHALRRLTRAEAARERLTRGEA